MQTHIVYQEQEDCSIDQQGDAEGGGFGQKHNCTIDPLFS